MISVAERRTIIVKLVNELFKAFMAINPAFRQAWPTEEEFLDTKMQWVFAFEDKGIVSMEVIARGLKRIRMNASPFIPSIGQFFEMCEPTLEDIGAPSVENAYDEACRKSHPSYGSIKDWSHVCVQKAAQVYGAEIHKGTYKDTYNRFSVIYFDFCRQYGEGKIIDQLEHQAQTPEPEPRKTYTEGKYKFCRPGVLEQYENVKTRDEAMAICGHLLGTDHSIFKQFFGKPDHIKKLKLKPEDRTQGLSREQLDRYWQERQQMFRAMGIDPPELKSR